MTQTDPSLAAPDGATPAGAPVAAFERALQAELGKVVVGDGRHVQSLAIALLVRGHVLLQGVPGLGKTLLARSLAAALGGRFKRIQGTADLMPGDVIGVHVYDTARAGFVFRPGPLFADVVLVDEINRAGPKTQSALLEAMEERQVSSEGELFRLPPDFMVIATQNPREFEGTYPLPESQLDRFLMRIRLGYPDAEAERALLAGAERRAMIDDLPACIDVAGLVSLQARVRSVFVADALIDYVQALLAHTRRAADLAGGLSPRAGLALLNGARAWALIDGRNHVEPEDVQAILPSVAGHRLHAQVLAGAVSGQELAERLMAEVAVP